MNLQNSGIRPRRMKKLFYAAAMLLCFHWAAPGAALAASNKADTAKTPTKAPAEKVVVARVNGDEVTMDALVKMMNRISAQEASADGASPDNEAMKQLALNRLVLLHLALQKAKADGLKADAKNVDNALENVKKNLGGEEEYKKFLEDQKVSEADLRSQVERSLTLELAYAREVYAKVVVPEDAIKKQYEKEKSKYVTPEKMRVTDVLFLPQDKEDAAMKNAKEVLKKIKADKEQDPWKLSLDGTFIVRTYDINKDKDKELYQEGKKLKVGKLSGVIKTSKALHIIKVKEYEPERQLSLDEVKGNIENALRVPAQDKRLQEWEQELRKNAKIEIVWPELKAKNS